MWSFSTRKFNMDSKLQVSLTLLSMLTFYILSCYCFLQAQEAIIQAHCDSSHEARKNNIVMLVGGRDPEFGNRCYNAASQSWSVCAAANVRQPLPEWRGREHKPQKSSNLSLCSPSTKSCHLKYRANLISTELRSIILPPTCAADKKKKMKSRDSTDHI